MRLAAIWLCPFAVPTLFQKRSGLHSCRRSFHQGEIPPEVLQTLRATEERGEIG